MAGGARRRSGSTKATRRRYGRSEVAASRGRRNVGVQDDHRGASPGEAVPALVSERVERVRARASRRSAFTSWLPSAGNQADPRMTAAYGPKISRSSRARRAERIRVVAYREHEVRAPGLDHRGDGRLVVDPAAEVANDREREACGAGRRRTEPALGDDAGAHSNGVRVVPARGQAREPDNVVDAAPGVDCGCHFAGSRTRAPGPTSRNEMIGAALPHALGHGTRVNATAATAVAITAASAWRGRCTQLSPSGSLVRRTGS